MSAFGRDTITVVVATYNRADLIMRTIASAVPQCDAVIVVDDCSTDSYDQAVIEAAGPNVQYIRLGQNSGPQVARNTGLAAVETEWAVVIDDDDEFDPDVLRGAIQTIKGLQGYEEFRVFNFATSNGSIPVPFKIVTHGDYLTRSLVGDFTPVLNMKHPRRPSYVPPEVRGAGTDHIMWWQVASEEGIPTWRDIRLQRMLKDSQDRLTSPHTFIKNALAFASMQSMTLTQIRQNGWAKDYPEAEKLRMRALMLYSLVSGDRGWIKYAASQFSGIERHAATFAGLIPTPLYRTGFYWARRWRLRKTH